MDAAEEAGNESDNDDFWEELDCGKRAAGKKANSNQGAIAAFDGEGCV